MENEIQLIDSRAAAKVLSLSRSKLYDMVGKGEIPHIKFDRHIRFNLADLKQFIEYKKINSFKYDFNILDLKGKNYRKK